METPVGSRGEVEIPVSAFPRNSRAMAKKFTLRGNSAVFRAVVIKALLNSRRGNYV